MGEGAAVAIVDTGLGNFGSLRNMCKRIGMHAVVTRDRRELVGARRIILPGVGSFDEGMRRLRDHDLVGPLDEAALGGVPMLGVCLGMQLMTRGSEEGTTEGLGWIAADTRRLPESNEWRVPHMGWNAATPTREGSIFAGVDPADSRYYFVHSYFVDCDDADDVLAWTEYGTIFASAVEHASLVATQFHPEKSHRYGMQILKNFCGLG